MCEAMTEVFGGSASERFHRYLRLMNKYDYYFFSEEWPAKYNYDEATTFTQKDLNFLHGTAEAPIDKSEFQDRLDTVCLRKNVSMEGFEGFFGMLWTMEALEKR
jgi:hypothetical protein